MAQVREIPVKRDEYKIKCIHRLGPHSRGIVAFSTCTVYVLASGSSVANLPQRRSKKIQFHRKYAAKHDETRDRQVVGLCNRFSNCAFQILSEY